MCIYTYIYIYMYIHTCVAAAAAAAAAERQGRQASRVVPPVAASSVRFHASASHAFQLTVCVVVVLV